MEYFVDEFETLRDRDLSDEEREYVQEKFDRMYVTKDIYTIYNWLMEDCGYPCLADVPCEKRSWSTRMSSPCCISSTG